MPYMSLALRSGGCHAFSGHITGTWVYIFQWHWLVWGPLLSPNNTKRNAWQSTEGKCHILRRHPGVRALVTAYRNPLPKCSFWANDLAMH